MMKMMNPMSSMPSVPGTEEKDDKPEMTMAEKKEVERLRSTILPTASGKQILKGFFQAGGYTTNGEGKKEQIQEKGE